MIISLIIAGVSAGQSLVTASRLRSVITDVQSFSASVNAFKLQYNALPGDITNASAYWTCPNISGDNNNCNGNGNRQMDWYGGGNGGGNINNEPLRFWQHLQLAGLLPNYVVSGNGGTYNRSNSPASKIRHSLYFVQYATTNYFRKSTTALALGFDGGSSGDNWVGVDDVTPIVAQSIDAKMDDGVANKGKMYGETGNGAAGGVTACSAAISTSGGADYNLQGAGPCNGVVYFLVVSLLN